MNQLLEPQFLGNSATAYGQYFETAARNAYMKNCKSQVVKCSIIIHPTVPFFGYSPDGLLFNEGRLKLLEIKCPIPGSHRSAVDVVTNLDYLTTDDAFQYSLKEKHMYYGQIQLGLYLTGADVCDLVIYASFDNSFVKIVVKKDRYFLLNMLNTLCQTYFYKMLPAILNYAL